MADDFLTMLPKLRSEISSNVSRQSSRPAPEPTDEWLEEQNRRTQQADEALARELSRTFPDPEAARIWLSSRLGVLDGASPIDLVITGKTEQITELLASVNTQ